MVANDVDDSLLRKRVHDAIAQRKKSGMNLNPLYGYPEMDVL